MKIERLAGVLQGVQDQIRFCDTKAQVILGLNGILAGFLATRASELASTIAGESRHVIAVGLFLSVALYLVFLVSSFAFGVRVVLPRSRRNSLAYRMKTSPQTWQSRFSPTLTYALESINRFGTLGS